MWGSASFYDVYKLSSYARALAFWEGAKPIRGRDENIRPLGDRKRHNMVNIRKLWDGSLACRLYSTDAVTYRPDETIEIVPYASAATNDFVNRLTPFYAYFTSPLGCALQVKLEIYCIDGNGPLVVAPGHVAIKGATPFERKILDAKAAAKAYKDYLYPEFRQWLKAVIRLNPEMRLTPNLSSDVATQVKAGPESWGEILERQQALYSYRYSRGPVPIEVLLANVRDAIARDADCFDTVTAETLSPNEFHQWCRAKRW